MPAPRGCLLPGVGSALGGMPGPGTGVPGLGEGVPGPGGVPGGDPHQDGYCYGQYASYWNAFLFKVYSQKQSIGQSFSLTEKMQ